MTKSVRQHKVVKGGKQQKSESSLICVINAEEYTNALPVSTSIPAHFCIPVSLYNNNNKNSKPKQTRLKFDLEKLKDSNVLETFQAMIGGRFAPLTIMSNEDTDIDSMITTFNTAVTETACEMLGK